MSEMSPMTITRSQFIHVNSMPVPNVRLKRKMVRKGPTTKRNTRNPSARANLRRAISHPLRHEDDGNPGKNEEGETESGRMRARAREDAEPGAYRGAAREPYGQAWAAHLGGLQPASSSQFETKESRSSSSMTSSRSS